MQMRIITNRWRVGGCFLFAFGALSLGVLQAQEGETLITTSEEPVVVIDSYEAALDGNGKSDLKIGEAVEPDFFNDIVDRIRGIFTNDDGSIEIGFLSGVFKSDTPALKIDAAGDAIFRGDLTARTIKSAGDLTVGSPEEPSKTEGKAITVGDKDRGVIELHGGDGQDIIAKGIVQMGDFGMELGTLTNQILKFFTNSTPRMSITSDGNVGIGTDDPGAKLNIYGTDDDGWNSGIQLDREGGGQGRIVVDGDGMKLRTTKDGDGFYFRDNDNQTSLFIKDGGNVGIGTTDPDVQLEIDSKGGAPNTDYSVTTENAALSLASSQGGDVGIGTGTRLLSGIGGSEYVWLQSQNSLSAIDDNTKNISLNPVGGNVGIGTTDPKSTFHVSSDTAAHISIENNYDDTGRRWGLYSTAGNSSVGGGKFAIMDWSDLSSTQDIDKARLVINSSGNVGIGTTDPDRKLEVAGTIKTIEGNLDLNFGDDNRLIIGHDADVGDWVQFRPENAKGLAFLKGPDSHGMVVTSSGNVGIGTTDPGAKLEVVNSSDTDNDFLIHSSSTLNGKPEWARIGLTREGDPDEGYIGFYGNADAQYPSGIQLGVSGANPIRFWNNNSEAMRIGPNGNVGIGTTDPGAKLEVEGNGTIGRFVNASSSGSDTGVKIVAARSDDTSGETAYLDLADFDVNEGSAGTEFVMARVAGGMEDVSGQTGFLHFLTNSGKNLSEKMRIDKNGNVGIGTMDPGAKLEVNGNVKIQTSGGTWITGKSGTQGLTGSGQTTSAYHPFLRQKTSSGHYVNLGGLGDDFGFFGYDKDRTANGYNYYFGMNLGNGRVGIGTRSPSTKLDVNGSITANSLYVRRDGSGTYPNLGEFEFVGTSGMPHLHVKNSVGRNIVQQFRGIDSSGNSQYFNLHLDVVGKNFSLGGPAANKVNISGSVTADYLNVDPQNTTIEGGEISLRKSSDDYENIQIDNYAGNARIHTLASGKYFEVVGGAGIKAKSFVGDGSQLTNLPVTNYSLPEASATALGGIKVGSNLSISNGVLSATDTNTQLTEADVDDMVSDNGYLTSYTETDPNVNSLGKASLNCEAGEIPKYDSYVWICSSDNNTWRSIDSVTDSTSTTIAASLSAVKAAYDMGNHSHPYLSTSGGTVSGSITATSFLYSSDENKKKNIQTLSNPLETIQNLRGVSFRWQENDEKSIGFIAQEVEKVLPSLVSGENGEKSVAYGNITAVLVEAVKELSAQNKALQKKNQELDQRVSALESK